jgi:type I restriction enzyme, S subunit
MTHEHFALRDIVDPRPGTRNPALSGATAFAYVDLEAVDRDLKSITAPKHLAADEAPSRARKVIRANDVLVALVRPNLNAVAIVPPELDDTIASTGFCVLRATERVLPEYLYYFVRSQRFVANLCGLVSGAMYPAVTERQVLDQDVALPPVDEQRRIVDLLSRAENIVRMRREAEARAKEIIPALFLDMFGDPARNERGWEVAELRDHIELVTGYPFKSQEFVPQGETVRLCRGANVLPQQIDWSDARHLPASRRQEFSAFTLERGDVVLAMDRPWISTGLKVARISEADLPSLLVQRVARIRPKPTVHASYIYAALCHPSFATHCNAVKTETVVPHISPHDIRSYRLPIPPLPIQHRFVRAVETGTGLSDQTAQAREMAAGVFKSLLSGVFQQ